jgi:hypothetical protein
MDSINDLILVAGKKAVILVEKEEDVEMVRISVNGEWVIQGNYWDFHPHCGGSLIQELRQRTFEWLTHKGLVEAIQRVLPKETEVLIVRRRYSYATDGGRLDPVTEEELSMAERHPNGA